MRAQNKKRLVIVVVGTVAAAALYVAAYFACVSVQMLYAMGIDGPTGARVYAYYRVGHQLQNSAAWFFEPVRLCDAYYFRPHLWNEPKWNGKVLPLMREMPNGVRWR